MELVELPTCAAAHNISGGAVVGQDKKQDCEAGTQNGEQTVLGLKRKVCITDSFLSMGLVDQILICVCSGCLAGRKDLHTQVETGSCAH